MKRTSLNWLRRVYFLAITLGIVQTAKGQSALYHGGFQVPETIAIGQVNEVNIPSGATYEEVTRLIEQAIKISSKTTTTHIKFAPGATYRLSPSANSAIELGSVKNNNQWIYPTNLIFDGQGCKFVVTTRSRFMRLQQYENVIIKDFEVDWDTRCITHAKLTAYDWTKGKGELTIEPGYRLMDDSYYSESELHWLMPMQKMEDGSWGMYPGMPSTIGFGKTWVKKGDRTFEVSMVGNMDHGRLPCPSDNDNMMLAYKIAYEKGDFNIGVLERLNGTGVLYVDGGKNMTFRDVQIHHSPASVVGDQYCIGNVYYNVKVNYDGSAIFGTTADGIFVTNQRNGPWIENCEFRGLGDDATVFKNSIHYYNGKVGTNAAYPYKFTNSRVWMNVGDTIVLYNMKTRQLVSKHRVTANANSNWVNEAYVNVEPAITAPANDENIWVYNLNTQCNNFVLKNNKFTDYRRWGVLCGGANGTIVGNTFKRGQNCAIYMVNSDNYEMNLTGAPPRNIEIVDNNFEDCWHALSGPPYAVIASRMNGDIDETRNEEEVDKTNDWNGIKNIVIKNNRFKDWYFRTRVIDGKNSHNVLPKDVHGIYMRDAKGVTICYNHFEVNMPGHKELFDADIATNKGDKVIRLVDCDNVWNHSNNVGNDSGSNLKDVTCDWNEELSCMVTDGVLKLKSNKTQIVSIYAVDGRMMYSASIEPGVSEVHGLHFGIYLVRSERVSGKIVIDSQ